MLDFTDNLQLPDAFPETLLRVRDLWMDRVKLVEEFIKYFYDLITLLFTHCVVFIIPSPEVKTPKDRSRMRREE